MLYVTGMHALNLPCRLQTCGDWHASAIQWEKPAVRESRGSVWGDYGIEKDRRIPGHAGSVPVADHIRALLDLIAEGRFDLAQGMKKDFICNDSYNKEIFGQVCRLEGSPGWDGVSRFMHREYGKEWRLWKDGRPDTGT